MKNGFTLLVICVAPTPLVSFNFGVLQLFLESCGDGPYQLSTLGAWGSAWDAHAHLTGRTRPTLIGLRGPLPLTSRPVARALDTYYIGPARAPRSWADCYPQHLRSAWVIPKFDGCHWGFGSGRPPGVFRAPG